MSGVNLEWFRALRDATKLPIVAAGGITTTREIRALEKIGMDSAVGMALYKNRFRELRKSASNVIEKGGIPLCAGYLIRFQLE